MRIVISFLTFIFVQNANAGTTVEVAYSDTANLFQILDCASQWWGDSCGDEGAYRKAWLSKSNHADTDLELFKKYSSLREKYYKNEDLNEKNPDRDKNGLFATFGAISADPIAVAFYKAANVEDALDDLKLVVSKEDLDFLRLFYERFRKVTSTFLEESIPFVAAAKRVNPQLNDPKYYEFLDEIKKFYKVDFDLNYKALYVWWPLKDRDYAYAVGDRLILSKNPKYQLNWPDKEVIFHEIVHTISARQTYEQKQKLTKEFLNECQISLKEHKNNVLEEPLAVAIGQMLFLKRFNQNRFKSETNWYRNPWVNKFSQKIFPLVEKYFANGQSIDVDFAKAAGKICKDL